MGKWEAKKKHIDRRVDTYSHPGVSEVIYGDEWKRKKQNLSLFSKIKNLFK